MRNRKWVVAAVFMLVMAAAGPSEASTAFTKLGRGVGNLLTGWLEIPAQIGQTSEADGSWAGLTIGTLKGLAFGIGRTVMGAVEIVTFPLPNHASGPDVHEDAYGPVLDPEFVTFRSADKL